MQVSYIQNLKDNKKTLCDSIELSLDRLDLQRVVLHNLKVTASKITIEGPNHLVSERTGKVFAQSCRVLDDINSLSKNIDIMLELLYKVNTKE